MLGEALNTQHFSIGDITVPFFNDLKLPLLSRSPQPRAAELVDTLAQELLARLESASPAEREAFLASSASLLPGRHSEIVKPLHLGLASLRSELRSNHVPTSLDNRFADIAKANGLELNEQFQGRASIRTPARRMVWVDMECDDFMGLGKLFSHQANQPNQPNIPLDIVLRTPANQAIARGLNVAKEDYRTDQDHAPLNIEFYDGATDLTQENDYRSEYFQRLARHCEQTGSSDMSQTPLSTLDQLAAKVATELNKGQPVDVILLCEPDDLMVLLKQVESQLKEKSALSHLTAYFLIMV